MFDQPFANHNGGHILFGPDGTRGQLSRNELLLESTTHPSSFGEDSSGDIYVCDHLKGSILRVSADGP